MPDNANTERLIDQARAELGEFYSFNEIDVWLNSQHKLLGGRRAIDVLGSEDAQRVFDLIDQLRSGAYV